MEKGKSKSKDFTMTSYDNQHKSNAQMAKEALSKTKKQSPDIKKMHPVKIGNTTYYYRQKDERYHRKIAEAKEATRSRKQKIDELLKGYAPLTDETDQGEVQTIRFNQVVNGPTCSECEHIIPRPRNKKTFGCKVQLLHDGDIKRIYARAMACGNFKSKNKPK